jgi:hypothetical protein
MTAVGAGAIADEALRVELEVDRVTFLLVGTQNDSLEHFFIPLNREDMTLGGERLAALLCFFGSAIDEDLKGFFVFRSDRYR